jgi:hypothetical protein
MLVKRRVLHVDISVHAFRTLVGKKFRSRYTRMQYNFRCFPQVTAKPVLSLQLIGVLVYPASVYEAVKMRRIQQNGYCSHQPSWIMRNELFHKNSVA